MSRRIRNSPHEFIVVLSDYRLASLDGRAGQQPPHQGRERHSPGAQEHMHMVRHEHPA